ncbi:response regulator [Ktedonosporobacter rubrisoli]|uniref:Response regulator n=1 Tax=Ktedonosporobacter rubrisoli TaxID=2509675 RepID=A0A4P6JJL2_KTERU|nr:response regulator [Ktedonosporobacter rubrisoli]QBD75120.1 response regulator [Ktedonosporobacter rubrisoli]
MGQHIAQKRTQLTVMLIDSNRAIQECIAPGLRFEGFCVEIAESGLAGIKLARRRKPDLLIIALELPDISGIIVCQRLRRLSPTRNIPILMLAKPGDSADRAASIVAGANDYLTAPLDLVDLLDRIYIQLPQAIPELLYGVPLRDEYGPDRATHNTDCGSLEGWVMRLIKRQGKQQQTAEEKQD